MTQEPYHIPALLPQVLDSLDLHPGGIYVDATYGGGGHSGAILSRIAPDGHLYSFDQDIEAIERAPENENLTLIHANFRFLENFMRYYRVDGVDGVLADLGVSFHHFDDESRGFSFRYPEAKLDMRMNRSSKTSAAQLLNNASPERLADIFYNYGELKQARRIASAIVSRRQTRQFETVADLLEVVEPLLNPQRTKKELAPVFQALRIEVNNEMDVLRTFLEQTTRVVVPGGKLAIITYHSLEDRLVKNFMKSGNIFGKIETDLFGRTNLPWKMQTGKPILPDENEILINPRSRSAKLRVAERTVN